MIQRLSILHEGRLSQLSFIHILGGTFIQIITNSQCSFFPSLMEYFEIVGVEFDVQQNTQVDRSPLILVHMEQREDLVHNLPVHNHGKFNLVMRLLQDIGHPPKIFRNYLYGSFGNLRIKSLKFDRVLVEHKLKKFQISHACCNVNFSITIH